MRESEKKGEASGRDDKIMIIEKRLESILHMCACIIRERGGEKGREGGRGRGKGREGGREREREREKHSRPRDATHQFDEQRHVATDTQKQKSRE